MISTLKADIFFHRRKLIIVRDCMFNCISSELIIPITLALVWDFRVDVDEMVVENIATINFRLKGDLRCGNFY